jgi:hypothetical protein
LLSMYEAIGSILTVKKIFLEFMCFDTKFTDKNMFSKVILKYWY